jgi:RNA polymerase sigma factor (sigma-70 family)
MTSIPLLSGRQEPPSSRPHGHGGAGEPARWSPHFDACFQVNYGRVLAYALRRSGDRAAAEDVAAETFLVAWRRLEQLPADQLPWLLATARNVLLNEHRSSRRRDRLAARVAAEPAASASDRGSDVVRERVRTALARLSERDREALLLTSCDGLDHRQAASASLRQPALRSSRSRAAPGPRPSAPPRRRSRRCGGCWRAFPARSCTCT